jgi:TfoX/Sxy family transcriptional regulator of competence genes
MASKASLVEFVVDQLGERVSARKMFGEYGIYRDGVLIGLVCDDRLFLKPTEAGRGLLGEVEEAPPYPGAKPAYVVPEERWDDVELMRALAAATAAALAKTPSARARARHQGASKAAARSSRRKRR